MDFKEQLPIWEAEGVKPPESKATEGWQIGDKPPADWFNWLQTRTYKSLLELRSNTSDLSDLLSEKADIKDLEDLISEVPNVFHDRQQNEVKESDVPSKFEHGLTLCTQSTRDPFPTINDYGVTITLRGVYSSYAQIFITKDGDIWSRRSTSIDSWNGSWYNAKREIKKVSDYASSKARTSTIVIANYDSHESSRKGADIVVEVGEDAAIKINDAIQSLKNTGGEVKLMEGNYQLDSKISILVDNVSLVGVGSATKLSARNLPSGSKGALIELGEDSNESENQVYNINIANLIVDGNNTKEDYRGIALWGAVNCTISNAKCLSNGNVGIQLTNNSSAAISNTEVTSNTYSGVLLNNDSSATISNAKCLSNENFGIQLTNNSSATISNTEVTSNKYGGVSLNDDSSATISNAKCLSNGSFGIQTADNSSATISNTKCSNNNKNGIQMFDNSSATISNAKCSNNNNIGISMFHNSSVAISGVDIVENKRSGVYIASSSPDILIRGAVLKDNYPNPEYANHGQMSLGAHNDYNTSNIFTTGCKIIDTKGNTTGVAVRGDNHSLTNTQFVGTFKEKINDGGKNTQLIGNVGV